MKKSTLSLAVLLLIGDSQAIKLQKPSDWDKNYIQFLEKDFDPLTQEMAQQEETKQSIAEAEKEHGRQIKTDKETMSVSLDQHTKLKFNGDNFAQASSIAESNLVQLPIHQMTPNGGVWLVQSDPIHGSAWDPHVDKKDLTAEQQFEQILRNKKPRTYTDDKENVTWTDESIKWAEENTGGRMPDPNDPKEKKKIKKTPKYHLADSDDEDEDTVETRRSVKQAEKKLQHRFFINAREKFDYEKALQNGMIPELQMNFKEDIDEDLGPVKDRSEKDIKKVENQVMDFQKKRLARAQTDKSNKEDEKREAREDAIYNAKQDSFSNAPPQKREPELPYYDSDMPAELRDMFAGKVKFAQQKNTAESESESDSESDDE